MKAPARAKRNAQELPKREARLVVSRKDFNALTAALDKGFAVNAELRRALDEARDTPRRAK